MPKTIKFGTLAATLVTAPAALAFAQATAGAGANSNGSGATGTAGPTSTAIGLNSSSSANAAGMTPAHGNTPIANTGSQPVGTSVSRSQSVTPGATSRLNGAAAGAGINTTGSAGGACSPSLGDPMSGALTPLTPRLSPAPTMGGCD